MVLRAIVGGLWLVLSFLSGAGPAAAQLNYGGPAAPSLELSLDIGRDTIRDEVMRDIVRKDVSSGSRLQSVAGTETSFFAQALSTPSRANAAIDTRFTRSKALQNKSQAAILAVVKKRQPAAYAEYADFFRKYDMTALFAKATADYGFSASDVSDTMAAYWLVAWVVANNGAEPSPASARAVRDQVKRGIAQTSVASYGAGRRHQLADEAIFNMIVLIELYDYTKRGRISRADFARAGDATQKAFLGFGADLRALRLTDQGFVKR